MENGVIVIMLVLLARSRLPLLLRRIILSSGWRLLFVRLFFMRAVHHPQNQLNE